MAQVRTFKDLLVWQKAHRLVLMVYLLTKQFPKDERFNLISQIRRSATSVASNIVEGFRRSGVKDSINFYNKADSSLEELRYQIVLSHDLRYISQEEYGELESSCEEVSKMLHAWIRSQRANAHLTPAYLA